MKGFQKEALSSDDIARFKELSRLCKGDILTMTAISESGHPGGSMSSLDIFLAVHSFANVSPQSVDAPDRDRIVVSHGHTAPGVYSVLGRLGYFDVDMAVATFRLSGSLFEGHVVRTIPGIDWGSGNLGQGLSAGCGFALASRVFERDNHVFVLMSDGEQTKGQVGEARRFARKYGLNNITVVVDYNKIQISGRTDTVMPCGVIENYMSDCWEVMEVDGHDPAALYQTLRKAQMSKNPVCIVAHTVIGKGVSFMEHKYQYHGKPLNAEEYRTAMKELALEPSLEKYKALRAKEWRYPKRTFVSGAGLAQGTPILYGKEEKTDNRTAYGRALVDVAKTNRSDAAHPLIVVDCDLASSVKTDLFAKEFPDRFFQVGVQEHHAATMVGAASSEGIVGFFSDFGVFGVDETFNQHRLNDQNHTNVKLVCTHVGLDVGEDGKTHQCIDYVGLLRNLYDFKVIVPADPNQTDRAVRAAAALPGNVFVGMGRSKLPAILKEDGTLYFDAAYRFNYGAADVIRKGTKGYLLAMGCLTGPAIEAYDLLKKEGVDIGVIGVSCPLALDEAAMALAAGSGLIVTCEDHHVGTGLGASVALYLAERGYAGKFFRLGIKEYGSSGKPSYLYKQQGLDGHSMADFIKSKIG